MKNYSKLTPEGTRDLLFEECEARRKVDGALSTLFKSRGFRKIITPTLEFFDVFNRESAGMPSETLYSVTDFAGRLLVLRPDSTLPIARVAATRLKDAQYPIRLYYNQSVFRRCPSFSGHNDESSQGGIELIGASGLRANLEVITTAIDALKVCGVENYRIELSHAGFFKSLIKELDADEDTCDEIRDHIEAKNFTALDEVLSKIGGGKIVESIRTLPRLFGGVEVLDTAWNMCVSDEAREAIQSLREICDSLYELGLHDKIGIDLGLVHRSNYYTGIVFRGYIEGSGEIVISGGRYDKLIGEFGKTLPANGFGVEISALAKTLLQKGLVAPIKPVDVLVFGKKGCEAKAIDQVRKLSENGTLCEYCLEDSLEAAKEYAVSKNIAVLSVVSQNGIEDISIGGK
ncbi:MAG: ATP phosphoribosyltransferase regulatory subunit [Clostridiales bacterium]|nr:ATP phosphoribosyltransferase regulatory subunit [Clostridiales bacterium]